MSSSFAICLHAARSAGSNPTRSRSSLTTPRGAYDRLRIDKRELDMSLGYDDVGTHNSNGNPRNVELQCSIWGNHSMRVTGTDEISAGPVVDRLRQVFDVKTDVALAEKLHLGNTAPSNWRQRNAPPYAVCVQVAGSHGVSLDWLVFGIGSMRLGGGAASLEGAGRIRSAEAERITRFVEFWDVTRPPGEMVWLEHQFKRAVPEYGDWLPGEGRS
jgi:Bacteriophage CI repressor helix-turn-helix domain